VGRDGIESLQIAEPSQIAPGERDVMRTATYFNPVDIVCGVRNSRGVKFDLDSKNVKNGKTIACYFADEIAGFAMHLVQA